MYFIFVPVLKQESFGKLEKFELMSSKRMQFVFFAIEILENKD